MVDPSEKLSNDHAHDAQSCCLANKMPQFFEHGLQPGAIGQLQSLPNMLVKRFAQGSALQPAISSASAVLQSTDEMEMAELHDPALARTEPDNSRNLVGDRGPDASVYTVGDRCDCLRPAPQVFSAWLKHRIEEDGSILLARLDRHHIQDPVFSSKAEIKSVQEQNQGSSGQAQSPRSRHELSQGATKTPTQALMGEAIAWRKSFQFLADSPRSLALTALTTSRTEVINFGLATTGFRVARMHARELDIDYGLKYPKAQLNSV